MIKIILYSLAAAALVAGQFFIVNSKIPVGAGLTALAVILAAVAFLEPWDAKKNRLRLKNFQKFDPSFALIITAVLLAFAGALVAKLSGVAALVLFILSGAAMAATIYRDKAELKSYGEIPAAHQKKKPWETWFLVAFILMIVLMRFYKIGDIPAGAHGHEAITAANCQQFERGPYVWHMGSGTEWPTTTAYQGMLFAKIFGWNIGSFRVEGALWGILSLLAFYFLARQLVSPVSAALASLLYASNFTHLLISRNLLASPILLVPPVLGLAFLIRGIKTGRWYHYLAAGLAIGLSLHGYIPGRVIPFVFAAWLVFIFIADRKNFPSLKGLAFLAAGFAVTGGPIVVMAIKDPGIYWEYFQSVNPNQKSGLAGYFSTLINNLPKHSGMFHIRADGDTSFHVAYEPMLDILSGALFPAGLFMCLLIFFRPMPAFFLGLFVAGMLPSMLGSGCSPQPNIRRMIVALPAIYMLCAFAFDAAWKRIDKLKNRAFVAVVAAVAIAASLLPAGKVAYDYFYRFANYPPHLVDSAHQLYLAGKEIRAHKGTPVDAMQFVFSNSASAVLIPKEADVTVYKSPEEILFNGASGSRLIFLDPFMEGYSGFFEEQFPGQEFKVYRQKDRDTAGRENPSDGNLYNKYVDKFNKFTFLVSAYLTEEAVNGFHQVYCESAKGATRVDPSLQSFKRDFAGQKVTLFFGVYLDKNQRDLEIKTGAGAWQAAIDGRPAAGGRAAGLDPGVHYVRLNGTVSEKFALSVFSGGSELQFSKRIFSAAKPYGMRSYYTPGEKSWDKKPEFSRTLLFNAKRFYDTTELPVPFCVRFKSVLRPDKNAKYFIKIETGAPCRITAAGKTVFDNLMDMKNPVTAPVEIDSSKGVELTADFQVQGGEADRTFLLLYKTEAMRDWAIVPSTWSYIY